MIDWDLLRRAATEVTLVRPGALVGCLAGLLAIDGGLIPLYGVDGRAR